MFFSNASFLHLNTLCKRSIFFEDFFIFYFFGRLCCFWKENCFCELWEEFKKRMAKVEARPDDGHLTEQGRVEEGEIVLV